MRLPPSVRRLIEALSEGDPVVREALSVAVPILSDPGLWRVMAAVAADERAIVLMTLRDAIKAVAQASKCDFCEARSWRVVLDVSHPDDAGMQGVHRPSDDLSLMAFLILCPSCAKLPPSERRRRKFDLVAKVQAERGGAGFTPFRRPAHIGEPIGSGGPLPPQPGLQRCEYCGKDVWISGDALEGAAAVASYVCLSCAALLAESGRLEACVLPTGFLDVFGGKDPSPV